MSDSQFGLLIATLVTFLSSLIGMLKWAVTRITKALDDNTESNRADTDAKIKLATEMAVFSTKLDHIGEYVEKHTPVEGVAIQPPTKPPTKRQPTPAQGLYSFSLDKKKG